MQEEISEHTQSQRSSIKVNLKYKPSNMVIHEINLKFVTKIRANSDIDDFNFLSAVLLSR